jgi:hypothetical protein
MKYSAEIERDMKAFYDSLSERQPDQAIRFRGPVPRGTVA